MSENPHILAPVAAVLLAVVTLPAPVGATQASELIRPYRIDAPTPEPEAPVVSTIGVSSRLAVSPPRVVETTEQTDREDEQDSAVPFRPLEPFRFHMDARPSLGRLRDLTTPPPTIDPVDLATGNRSLLFQFGRETNLVDGGLGQPAPGDGYTYTANPGERFDSYSAGVEWNPAGDEAPLQWLVVSGIHAIRADIGRLDAADSSLGLTEARGAVAIPTVGTGFRWLAAERFSISTLARTQSISNDASMVDLVVSAELLLGRGVGLSAGYEFYESNVTIESVQTSIDREGYFARLKINF